MQNGRITSPPWYRRQCRSNGDRAEGETHLMESPPPPSQDHPWTLALPIKDRLTHDANNSETLPWRTPPVWEWSWGRFIRPDAAPTTPTTPTKPNHNYRANEPNPPPSRHQSSRRKERGPARSPVEIWRQTNHLPDRLSLAARSGSEANAVVWCGTYKDWELSCLFGNIFQQLYIMESLRKEVRFIPPSLVLFEYKTS